MWIIHEIPTIIHVRISQLKIIIKEDVIVPLCPSWCRFYPTHSAHKLPSNSCTRRTWRPGWTGRVSRRSSLGWRNSSHQDSTNRNSNRKHISGFSRDCHRPCSTTPSNSSRKSHSAPRESPLRTPSNSILYVNKKICINALVYKNFEI